jgi:hypothetical protein
MDKAGEPLALREVNRNHIRAEGVQHEQSILTVGCLGQRNSRVAKNHLDLRRTVAQVGKQIRIAGNLLHQGINFVERESLAGRPLTRKSAGFKPHDRDIAALVSLRKHGEHLPHGSGWV